MGDLRGKVIVIVGGTTGLGLSAATACIEAGANVVAVGRSPESAEKAAEQFGGAGCAHVGDACEPDTADAAVRKALQTYGCFNGLYHVAGGSGRRFGDGPLHELSDQGIRKTLDLNLTALIYSNRAATQQFLKQHTAGTVLNMTSVLAFAPAPTFFATHTYAAAKAAVVGLTKSCAAYYAGQNIRFNAVAPGLVETPMSQRATGDSQILDYLRTKQPLDGGRVGRPDDLDGTVVYLLSDASRLVTGQVLAVDGGWSVSEGQHGSSSRGER